MGITLADAVSGGIRLPDAFPVRDAGKAPR